MEGEGVVWSGTASDETGKASGTDRNVQAPIAGGWVRTTVVRSTVHDCSSHQKVRAEDYSQP